jgi:5-methyltetrahydropteroyltriglutamate--homocysteine methyltransferase
MKKWLTSNYHYMVPEVDETLGVHVSAFTSYLESVKRGIDKLGAQRATPVVMGPVSFVRFCTFKQQGSQELQRFALLEKLLPVYKDLLAKLKTMGVKEIQIHEPALVFADTSLKTLFQQAYPCILPTNVAINMVSFFEGVSEDNFKWLLSVPQINILSLDFTRGDNLDLVKKFGVAGKTIGAGVIDGRNVWKIDPAKAIPVLKTLSESDAADIRIQPSCSLQFVPWDIECEHDILAEPLGSVLAFGQQKLKEVSDVCSVAAGVGNIDAYVQAWQSFQVNRQENTSVTNRVASLTESDFSRSEPYAVRRKQQLPGVILPTTTIGSFPQTKEIRSLRHQLKKGKISLPQYERAIDQQIAMMIGIQEGLGLDILVHGEPERTDMVEFFGQQMEGMAFTTNGWVQSFGSRCVRPPIIWTDISRPSSMTVREYQVAQLLTQKPVKGMLTG